MAYVNPSLSSLIAQAQADLSAQLGYTPWFESNENILAIMSAGLADSNYHFVAYCLKQTNPAQASGEYLDLWSNLVGLSREAASYATGSVTFTGTAGAVVPLGSVLIAANNLQYVTTAQFSVGVNATAPLQAVLAGAAGNLATGVSMTLTSPIAGIQSATVVNAPGISGGADVETDTSLRARTIFQYSKPPSGGSRTDFEGWALQVPGVTRAFVLPGFYPGPTSVTIMPMYDVVNASTNGFPSGTAGTATNEYRSTIVASGQLLTLANYLYTLQPVTPLVWCMSPNASYVTVTISGLNVVNTYSSGSWSTTPTTAETNILAALNDVITLDATAYGNLITISQLYSAVGAVQGVTTFDIVTPSQNITTPIGSLPVLQTVNFLP